LSVIHGVELRTEIGEEISLPWIFEARVRRVFSWVFSRREEVELPGVKVIVFVDLDELASRESVAVILESLRDVTDSA